MTSISTCPHPPFFFFFFFFFGVSVFKNQTSVERSVVHLIIHCCIYLPVVKWFCFHFFFFCQKILVLSCFDVRLVVFVSCISVALKQCKNVQVCVCVCVWEREREGVCVCVWYYHTDFRLYPQIQSRTHFNFLQLSHLLQIHKVKCSSTFT